MSILVGNPFFLDAGAGATGYQISRSLRFNSSDSAFLSRVPSSTGNRTTWTWAAWVKRSYLSSSSDAVPLFTSYVDTSNYSVIDFRFDAIRVINGSSGNGEQGIYTAPIYRDPSAWYHIVASSTPSSVPKLYVNGVEVTAFTSSSAVTANWTFNSTNEVWIGKEQYSSTINYFSGYLADVHFIDGQALTPSSFTEVSATTGQLIPKAYTGTFTGNSFWLKFADNSAATATTLGKDSSGLGNNWTPNNLAVWGGGAAMYSVGSFSNSLGYAFTTNGYLPAESFDGSLTTFAGNNTGGGTNTWTAPVSITVNTSLRVYVAAGAFPAGTTWAVNGTSQGSTTNGTWLTASLSTPYTLTSVSNTLGNSSTGAFFAAIEVDGVILVDKTNATNDSLVDTPTSYGTDTGVGGEIRGNYPTWNPLNTYGNITLTNGNLDAVATNNVTPILESTITFPSSGKWYAEVTCTKAGTPSIGIGNSNLFAYAMYRSNGSYLTFLIPGATASSSGATYTTGDIIGIAYNADSQSITFYKNGSAQSGGFTGVSAGPWSVMMYIDATGDGGILNAGQRPFAYTAPSGFKALCDTNLPAPVVAKPSTVMDVKLYTGNGSTQTISGLGFSPDLVWVKCRSVARSNFLFDTVRGAAKYLISDTTGSEVTDNTYLTAFTSDGFSVDSSPDVNRSATPIVAWTWDAGSSTVTNTAGSITSQVRTNGYLSIVTYTGNGTGGATVGHGGLVNLANGMIIVKRRDSAVNWFVGHGSQGWTKVFEGLNTTNAISTTSAAWNNTSPTSTVFTLGTETSMNGNGGTFVAYCFAPVTGYSSFGSYTGNGSADGPFVFTGMRPRWLLIKQTDVGRDWRIYDTSRNPYNLVDLELYPNAPNAEAVANGVDSLSNGFKLRSSGVGVNSSGGTYIYAAFAENPFQYARAR